MNADKVLSSPLPAAAWRCLGARRLATDGFRVAILSSSGRAGAGGAAGWLGVTGSNQSPDDLARLVEGALTPAGAASTCWSTAPATAPRAHSGHQRRRLAARHGHLSAERDPSHAWWCPPCGRRRRRHRQHPSAWAQEPPSSSPPRPFFAPAWRSSPRFCRHPRGAGHSHEQRAARLDRQPAGDRGAPPERADAALWPRR